MKENTWAPAHEQLTPYRRVPEKLKVTQPVKKTPPPFYGTQRFITMFTKGCHLSYSASDASSLADTKISKSIMTCLYTHPEKE